MLWVVNVLPSIRDRVQVAPSMRGYGESSAPADDSLYSAEHICSDLCALLDHLDVRAAVLIGHDWGGSVVWWFTQVRVVCSRSK